MNWHCFEQLLKSLRRSLDQNLHLPDSILRDMFGNGGHALQLRLEGEHLLDDHPLQALLRLLALGSVVPLRQLEEH